MTAPPRTLLDVASFVDERELARMVNEALVLGLTNNKELCAAVVRCHGRRGIPALRRLLARAEGPRLTRSEAERRFLRLLELARLPMPETNVRILSYEVDMLWRSAALVVEIDGYAYHSTRAAFERDRVRDADLQASGLRVLRFTWRQITDQPEVVAARVSTLLQR